ncbi:M24 family metallopeptidase [Exiguobacterium algae]|uniref:M24 family metallopeptidase n=1 Tax=Exiguobacterium algae TaxID=2751250 RepID=UPI001BEC826A|nr:Xaa-Pro peptidase family protein [Exiguobacterium algae]
MIERVNKLQGQLEANGIDAMLVTKRENIRYLSGFTGSSGVIVVTAKSASFITDFRYTEQANAQVSGYEIIELETSLIKSVADVVARESVARLGVEQDAMTVGQFRAYEKEVGAQLVETSGVVEKLRLIKDESEIKIMKEAAAIADEAFTHIQTFIRPGRTEKEVANELEMFMRSKGADSSSFDMIVASGTRSALPHGVASDKVIESGELVTLDFGAYYKGYCSDITRTLAVGPISDELKKIYDTVLRAQLAGVEGTRAGITGIEADALTRDVIKEAGYGEYFGHSTGHGLGMEVHEAPGLSFRSETVLEPGMVVTIEPGIYIAGVGGCRIEDDVVITEDGCVRLTQSPKELITIEA